MLLCLYVELSIVSKKRLDWLLLKLLLASPLSVGNNHLTELSSVISEVVNTYNLVTHLSVKVADSITDNSTSDMTDMERLRNVRR